MPQFWAGFVNGKIDVPRVNDGFGGANRRRCPALFTNRQQAREQYQDVRKVEVRTVSKVKK